MVAKQMRYKPYSPDAAATLLRRVVEHVNVPGRRNGSRVLRALLEAPIGDVSIGDAVVAAAANAVPTTLERTFGQLRQVLEALVTKPQDGRVHDALVMPQVRLTAAASRGGHYLFTVSETYSPTGQIDLTAFAWLQLLRVVHRAGPGRLCICRSRLSIAGDDRECGRLFVRVGKRRFCSETCQNRDYQRRFRADEAGRG